MDFLTLLTNGLRCGLVGIGLFLLIFVVCHAAGWVVGRLTGRDRGLADLAARDGAAVWPAVVAVIWYAGFAAWHVRSAAADRSTPYAAGLHLTAAVCFALVLVAYRFLFRGYLDVHRTDRPVYFLALGGVAVYALATGVPAVGTALAETWMRVNEVLSFCVQFV